MSAKERNSNASNETITRRSFLNQAAAAGVVGLAAPAIVRGRGLNDKLNLAIIGAGGRGAANLRDVESENIAILCDVNEEGLNKAAQRHPGAHKIVDFRKVYDRAKDFDAVVVSTAEHTHAFATLPALQLGKHVYCEKPMAGSWADARAMLDAAGETGRRLHIQLGLIYSDETRAAKRLIGAGMLGGTLIGVSASVLFIPFLQVRGGANPLTPPFLVRIAWDQIAIIYLVFGGILVGAVVLTLFLLRRMQLFQAVKLGEAI